MMRKILKNMMEWIVPPKVKALAVELIYGRKKKLRKYWYYTPLKDGLHDLPYFASVENKPEWISLDKEVRPAIVVEDSLELKITLNDSSCDEIQLGVGIAQKNVKDVRVFINNERVGGIEDIHQGYWHDIPLSIAQTSDVLEVRIEVHGGHGIYLSHPILRAKSHAVPKHKTIKNIICIVLDGVIPEFFTPENAAHILKFFDAGRSCTQTYCQGDWTLPAFSSMLSGFYPSRHLVCNPDENDSSFNQSIRTLPEMLLQKGYRTFGYSGHLRFSPAYGHAKGFERFIFRPVFYGDNYLRAIHETKQHLEVHKNENNFVFLHIFDTHPPFRPTSYLKESYMNPQRHHSACLEHKQYGLGNNRDYVLDDWCSKLKEVDFALQDLFNYIENQDWKEDALFVLTSDHGLPEIKEDLPLLLHDRIHIPLYVKGPQIAAGEDASLIEGSVDLMPSILHWAGAANPGNINGQLWPFLSGNTRQKIFSESLYVKEYNAVIRDNDFSYHYKCPFDHKVQKIKYQQGKPVAVFDKNAQKESDKGNLVDQHSLEEITKQFEEYFCNKIVRRNLPDSDKNLKTTEDSECKKPEKIK